MLVKSVVDLLVNLMVISESASHERGVSLFGEYSKTDPEVPVFLKLELPTSIEMSQLDIEPVASIRILLIIQEPEVGLENPFIVTSLLSLAVLKFVVKPVDVAVVSDLEDITQFLPVTPFTFQVNW